MSWPIRSLVAAVATKKSREQCPFPMEVWRNMEKLCEETLRKEEDVKKMKKPTVIVVLGLCINI